MKVSDFIGKTVKEIIIEQRGNAGDSRGCLIKFDDGSQILAHDAGNIFYDADGMNTENDIASTSYSEFFNRLGN